MIWFYQNNLLSMTVIWSVTTSWLKVKFLNDMQLSAVKLRLDHSLQIMKGEEMFDGRNFDFKMEYLMLINHVKTRQIY